MTQTDERSLALFKRKVNRKIYGPVRDVQNWRIIHNTELCNLYKESDVIRTFKLTKRLCGEDAE